MTKLNYVNRKSNGVKLGQIVAKDIRKRCKPPSSSSSSKPDQHKDASPIELQLDGKELTDEGLAAIARSLEDALNEQEGYISTKVHTLSLSGNALTAKSLQELTLTVKTAGSDLEEMDLSNNAIRLDSDDDLAYWESFLEALSCCEVLKTLNLSGNRLADVKGWEIFSRVYSKHTHANSAAIEFLADEDYDLEIEETASIAKEMQTMSFAPEDDPKPRIRGLPSIVAIKLFNTGVTDCGALFLSYCTGLHQWIHCKAKKTVSQQLAAQSTCGIVYQPNEGLSAIGQRMLKAAQTSFHLSATAAPPVPENSPMLRNGSHDATVPRRTPSASHHRTASQPEPLSFSSFNPGDDLESLRRKIQRTTLEEKGPQSAQLWSTALRLLAYVRGIMIEDKDDGYLLPFDPSSSWTYSRRRSTASQCDSSRSQVSPYPSNLCVTTAGTLSSAIATPDTTDTTVQTPITRSRRGSFFYYGDSPSPSTKTKTDAGFAVMRAAAHLTDTNAELIGPFPARPWGIILRELADPAGILSEKQTRAVIAWGRDRRTLAFEMEALGKPDSVQIWRVLDAMECLSYVSSKA